MRCTMPESHTVPVTVRHFRPLCERRPVLTARRCHWLICSIRQTSIGNTLILRSPQWLIHNPADLAEVVKSRFSLEFTHFFSYRRSMQCLPRICGQYRPNRTPGTKSGVGACVRPARQSRDCLRGRPLRAPPLFAAVRSALGSVLPTVARGASAALRRIPAPPAIPLSA